MDGFPTAIIMARREAVLSNTDVLFRLVKPNASMDGVESATGLVNVMPQGRIYRMATINEMETFKRELLKRPLVLQPVSLSGYGLGTCGVCYRTVPWVLLVNQTHPKILGRLQMGADAAKHAIKKGYPFELRFQFGKLLRRLHYQVVEQLRSEDHPEVEEFFRFADWDFCDLIVRYPGRVIKKPKELNFDFCDLSAWEMKLRSQSSVLSRNTAPMTGDEIRAILPGWTVNHISPLDDIGEEVPEAHYSYAKAGKLYESFRKKKRQRARNVDSTSEPEPLEGATAMPVRRMRDLYPSAGGQFEEVVLDDIHTGIPMQDLSGRRAEGQHYDRPYYNAPDAAYGRLQYPLTQNLPQDGGYYNTQPYNKNYYNTPPQSQPADRIYYNSPSTAPSRSPTAADGGRSQNLYPVVNLINGKKTPHDRSHGVNASGKKDWYNYESGLQSQEPAEGGFEGHRDSDRSSRSTATSSGVADSGYADSDGPGGDNSRRYGSAPSYDNMVKTNSPTGRYGAHDNFGYEHDRVDIMKSHQEFVQKAIQGGERRFEDRTYQNDRHAPSKYPTSPQGYKSPRQNDSYGRDNDYALPSPLYDTRQPRSRTQVALNESEPMAESFI